MAASNAPPVKSSTPTQFHLSNVSAFYKQGTSKKRVLRALAGNKRRVSLSATTAMDSGKPDIAGANVSEAHRFLFADKLIIKVTGQHAFRLLATYFSLLVQIKVSKRKHARRSRPSASLRAGSLFRAPLTAHPCAGSAARNPYSPLAGLIEKDSQCLSAFNGIRVPT